MKCASVTVSSPDNRISYNKSAARSQVSWRPVGIPHSQWLVISVKYLTVTLGFQDGLYWERLLVGMICDHFAVPVQRGSLRSVCTVQSLTRKLCVKCAITTRTSRDRRVVPWQKVSDKCTELTQVGVTTKGRNVLLHPAHGGQLVMQSIVTWIKGYLICKYAYSN
jgi:hypothetical protein